MPHTQYTTHTRTQRTCVNNCMCNRKGGESSPQRPLKPMRGSHHACQDAPKSENKHCPGCPCMLLSLGLPTKELLLVCGTVSSAHFLQSVWSPVVTEEAVQSMCSVCTLCLLPQPPSHARQGRWDLGVCSSWSYQVDFDITGIDICLVSASQPSIIGLSI